MVSGIDFIAIENVGLRDEEDWGGSVYLLRLLRRTCVSRSCRIVVLGRAGRFRSSCRLPLYLADHRNCRAWERESR